MALPFLVHWIRIFTNLDFFFSFFTTQSISTNTISITCNWKLFKRPEPLCVSCPWICLLFGFGLKIQLFPISLPLVTSRFLKKKRVKLHLLCRFYLDNIQNTSPEKVFKRKKLTRLFFWHCAPNSTVPHFPLGSVWFLKGSELTTLLFNFYWVVVSGDLSFALNCVEVKFLWNHFELWSFKHVTPHGLCSFAHQFAWT